MFRTIPFLIILLVAAAPAAWGAGLGAIAANPGDLCARETARAERDERIPSRLLRAISQVESGRWDKERGENVAWPWTVTAEGRGRYLPTRQAAIDEVRALQKRGIRNIDVGCMQVNLYYHGDAFINLEEAFEPRANVDYAARFLKRLHGQSRNWIEAASSYHSNTPHLNERYRTKVTKVWRDNQVRAAKVRKALRPRQIAKGRIAPARDRMEKLNTAFRTRKAAARAEDPAMVRHRQIGAWREAQVRGLDATHLAHVQRARKRLEEKVKILEMAGGNDFAAKRRAQIGDWRRRVAKAGG